MDCEEDNEDQKIHADEAETKSTNQIEGDYESNKSTNEN